MSWLGAFRHRLVELLRFDRADRELEEELHDHLAREVDRQVTSGAPHEDARRRALIRSGSLRSTREAAADERTGRVIADALTDLRIGLRVIRRSPGFALAVIVSLALGVGGTTAMYTIVHAVLVRELPYADADRLFMARVWWKDFSSTLSNADFLALQEQTSGVARVGAFYVLDEGFTMSAAEGPQVVRGGAMTRELPDVLGVAPIAGRGFSSDPNAREALLSESLWRQRFNGSTDAIGRTVILDGDSYAVVGIMPRGFNVPGHREGAVWIKARINQPTRRGPFFLGTIVRLSPEVSAEAAAGTLTTAVSTILLDKYRVEPTWRYRLRPLKDTVVGDIRQPLLLLLGAMGLVLLIAIVNVSGLLLARGTVRAREMAVRASLGARRGRLVRQLVVESALLGLMGGALGLLLASFLVNVSGSIAATMLPRLDEVRLNAAMVAFALTCGIGAGVLAGLLPAARIPWRNLLNSLRDASRTASPGFGHARARQALVVAEIALTVMILAAALLLAKSLFRLEAMDPGFRADGVVTFRLSLPNDPYASDDRQSAFMTSLDEKLRALGGVSAAAFSIALPPNLLVLSNNYTLEGTAQGSQGASGVAEWIPVSAEYFSAMGIRFIDGRAFSADDRGNSPRVAVVNETFARRHFPDGRAIGRRLKGGDWNASAPWTTIVGTVADVPYGKGIWGGADATVYLAYSQNLWWQSPYGIVKATGDPSRLVMPIRQAVASIDPNLPLRDVATMNDRLRASMLEPRVRSLLFALLGGLALSLAITGIYGVMSYHVNQRRREIAIRRALGARAREVVTSTIASGLRLALVGIVLGTGGAIVLSRGLSTLLFRVSPRDPAVLLTVTALLATCALLACAIPAFRTVGVDPASVLREE